VEGLNVTVATQRQKLLQAAAALIVFPALPEPVEQ
jgi:hypothetical protein